MYAQLGYLGQGAGPDVEQAAALLQSRGREFENLGAELRALMHEAALLVGQRRAVGDEEGARAAHVVIRELGALNHDYGAARDKLRALVPKIPALGLGAVPVIPLIYAGTAVALAVAMASIFRRKTAQEKMLDMIRAGALTVGDAERINIDVNEKTGIVDQLVGGIGSAANSAMKILLGGGLVLGLLQAGVFEGRLKRARR